MTPAAYLALVLTVGAVCQLVAYRLRIPSILLLLVAGFGLGQLLSPEKLLGRDVLFAGVSLAVAVILFEGSLSLRFRDLRGLSRSVWRLCTVTVALAWVLITSAAMVAGLPWELALLVGALLVVTGPTVIAPIVRQLRPTRRVSSMLRWEGIVVDPIGAVLALLVFQAIIVGGSEGALATAGLTLVRTVVVATVLSVAVGALLEVALRRYVIPDFLEGVCFLAAAVGAFVLSGALQPDSGLLTVTMLGIYLANRPGLRLEHVREFKENLQILIVGTLFVLLAGRVTPAQVVEVAPTAVVFVTLLVLVVRPASVWLGLLGTEASRAERTLMAFMAPRGIVAASVTSVFALEIEHAAERASERALRGGETPVETLALEADAERLRSLVVESADLVPLVFVTIVVTVAVYGLGVGRLAERLGLATTTPNGVLFAGASTWARQAAEVLGRLGVPTLLVSLAPSEVMQARLAGLRVERTHILSEYAVEDMELAGIGSLVAATYDDDSNSTAVKEFGRTLGSRQTYQLSRQGVGSKDTQRTASRLTGQIAFDPPLTAPELERRVREGMQVRHTRLTDKHSLAQFEEREPDAVHLFTVTGRTARVVTVADPAPQTGVTLVALVRPRV
ncbi:cation:proton antiporter [Ornithinimicrobium tianjinense]|uniref:Sodium:hydrogen antiporter n=1 Tax=Ornithinimicrobium tianjinense TaxID=1195761 RepID=A0A917FAH4_9MICO|nr:cation:proton antiporter [Ornithinimicrobium tianjinense]GGF57621.1 sodium:hydrogen antiporter [Ornithinimicrobium tianjinense]